MRNLLLYTLLFSFLFGCKPEEPPCIYTNEVIEYYIKITTELEVGVKDLRIAKWVSNPKIKIYGAPTEADLIKVNQVINDINALQNEIVVSITQETAFDIEMHFIRNDSFPSIMPGISTKALGIFGFSGYTSGIIKGIVLIDIDEEQPFRDKAIREELTQVLGLPNDSFNRLYPNSIFNGQVNPLQEYDPIDKLLISMHYSSVIKPGMKADEIRTLECWK